MRIYANTTNDRTVPYVTAAIEVHDPFRNALNLEMDTQYNHLIASYSHPLEGKGQIRSGRRLHEVICIFVPFIVCIVLPVAVVRLSLDVLASRARIQALEISASTAQKLSSHIFEGTENGPDLVPDTREMETAVSEPN
ncbi:DUF676-domain-containing protein [Mycena venus]|uniref:DUF676-domain-containing protein n=1 Tax=Mycena venus TaxID=2733690 RepID=A0A8H6Z2T2_9AGAR|nr:DUF676-domain-containing protein [Mycena venus]